MGLPGTTPSGCRRPSGRAWRHWGCGMCWTSREAPPHGRRSCEWTDSAPQGRGRQAQAGGRATAHHGQLDCPWREIPVAQVKGQQLQRPKGATCIRAIFRRNLDVLPVQRSRRHFGDTGLRGRIPGTSKPNLRLDWTSTRPAPGLAGIATWRSCWAGPFC